MRKNNLKSLWLLLVMLCMSLNSFAYDFEVDGIYYNCYLSDDNRRCVRVTSNEGYNSYSGSVDIPSIVDTGDGLTYSVTHIEDYAFAGCEELTSVTIPKSVVSIGDYAFQNCKKLTSVNIPYSVTSIGNCAFSGCWELGLNSSLYIPDSVKRIGFYAFDGCRPNSLYIGSSVEYIGSGAFSCTYINNLTFNCSNMTTIEWGAFESATIYSAYFPSVDSYFYFSNFFDNIASMEIYIQGQDVNDLIIPNSVTYIPEHAFEGKNKLTYVSIPSSVTEIGNDAFKSCYNLKKAEFGSIESLCAMKFWGTDSNPLYYTHELYIDGSEIKDLVIPNTVMSIGDYAFVGCSGLTSVTIPNSVTSIGRATFVECSGLTSVTIPNSVTEIDSYAFGGCSGLTSVVCEATEVPTVYDPFYGSPISTATLYVPRESLEKYKAANYWKDFGTILPIVDNVCGDNLTWNLSEDGTLTISGKGPMENYADQAPWIPYKERIKKVLIEDGVTSISDYAFYGCFSLISVIIGESVISIGDNAFSFCTGLTSVAIPNSLTEIGESAFSGCSSLTSVTFGNSVGVIGSYAFLRTSLTSVVIPNTVTSIEEATFSYCTNLTSVTIPNSVKSIGYAAFESCSNLTSVTIPNSVKSIGDLAFFGCSSLSSITIPNSVTSIGTGAFYECGALNTVIIPNSVTSIGQHAFDACSNLTTVICKAKAIPFSDGSPFYSCPVSTATLYVPSESLEKYKAANYWKDFGTILPIEGNIEDDDNNLKTATFTIPDVKMERGTTQQIALNMSNAEDIASFQMDIRLPEGMSFVTTGAGKPKLTDRAADFNLSSKIQENGDLRIIVMSMDDENIAPGEGPIVTFSVTAPAEMPLGDYQASLNNVVLVPYAAGAQKETAKKIGWNLTVSKTYAVSAATESEEKGTVSLTGATDGRALEGSSITATATANEGYEFSRWSDNATANPYTFTLTEDKNLTAYFTPLNYNVTFTVDGESTTTALPYKSVIPTPADPQKTGYVFMGWTPEFTEGTTVPLDGITYTAMFELKGDISGDGELDVMDVTQIVRYVLDNGNDPVTNKIADADGDGIVDVMDITLTIRSILNNGVWASAKQAMQSGKNHTDLYVTDFRMNASRQAEAEMKPTDANLTNLQFDMILPQGVKLSEAYIAGSTSDHTIYTNEYKPGVVRVLCVSLSNQPLSMSGSDITVAVEAEESVADAVVTIDNIVLTTATEKTTLPAITKSLSFTTGINAVEGAATSGAVYNALGIKQSAKSAGLNIIRKDNKNVKVFKK